MASTTEKPEVTIAELATTLKTDARTLRAFVRGLDLGCGRGTRYAWPSMSDGTVKRIVRAWQTTQRKADEETAG